MSSRETGDVIVCCQIREQSEKEKQLVAEVEKLRTQLKYNEFELRKTVADRDAQVTSLTVKLT